MKINYDFSSLDKNLDDDVRARVYSILIEFLNRRNETEISQSELFLTLFVAIEQAKESLTVR